MPKRINVETNKRRYIASAFQRFIVSSLSKNEVSEMPEYGN